MFFRKMAGHCEKSVLSVDNAGLICPAVVWDTSETAWDNGQPENAVTYCAATAYTTAAGCAVPLEGI